MAKEIMDRTPEHESAQRHSRPGDEAATAHQRRLEEIQLQDALTTAAAKLEAALAAIHGGGYEAFAGMPEELQRNYIWLCADLAHEVRKLSSTRAR